jgi:hypothetical protein
LPRLDTFNFTISAGEINYLVHSFASHPPSMLERARICLQKIWDQNPHTNFFGMCGCSYGECWSSSSCAEYCTGVVVESASTVLNSVTAPILLASSWRIQSEARRLFFSSSLLRSVSLPLRGLSYRRVSAPSLVSTPPALRIVEVFTFGACDRDCIWSFESHVVWPAFCCASSCLSPPAHRRRTVLSSS